jgi:2-keto-3-deoxy-L-fuconate dehydrogenase
MASGRLFGKTAVITAAGQGIGRSTSIAFADEGAAVWATDINEAALDSLSKERPSVRTRRLDIRDGNAVEALASELGAIDILFNCAGFVHHGTILDCAENDWDFSFDLNVKSMYRTCRAFLPAMLQAGRGSIINMSSAVSSVKGAPNRFAYGATKAAIIGFTKSVAIDFVGRGIRCNAICPGTVQTPSLDDRIAARSNSEKADFGKIRAEFVARQPMGRLGTPEEIAALAVYLASDESSFTTGQIHVIDGGWTI